MKCLIALLALAGAFLAPGVAAARPLGNFTVNRFSAVELSGRDVYVHYVLDLAEIPTYQEGGRVRSPSFPSTLACGFVLELDGTRTVLVPVKHKLSTKAGAGGLPTLRFEAVFRAHPRVQGTALVFHDTNFADRIGWKEVVVRGDRGASIQWSSVPSTSEELRAYPKNLLKSPLDVTFARARVELGSGPGVTPSLEDGSVPHRTGGGFESLVARGELGAGVILVSQFVVPERLYPWLTVASGLLVVAVGGSVFWSRWRQRRAHRQRHDHHRHHHSHAPDTRGLLGIGVAAGLLPCPSALVVLLSAISLHRVGFGLALIVAFSLGLAATITSFGRLALDGPLVRALPALSALVILAVGIGITVNALPEVM